MTSLPPGFTLLPDEEIEAVNESSTEIRLKLVSHNATVIGRLLDVIEHVARLGGIECTVDAPDYCLSFYGWERRSTRG